MNQFQRAKCTPEQLAEHDAGVKARAAENIKQWKRDNRDKVNAATRARRAVNPEKTKADSKKYRNPEKCRIYAADRLKNNPQAVRAVRKKNYEKTKAIRHENWAYKDAVRRGCPIGDRALIIPLYDIAVEMQRKTGVRWSVDHIIPLALGGHHRIENMQPMPLVLNHTKSGNPFWICDDGGYKDWRNVPYRYWPEKFKAIYDQVVSVYIKSLSVNEVRFA